MIPIKAIKKDLPAGHSISCSLLQLGRGMPDNNRGLKLEESLGTFYPLSSKGDLKCFKEWIGHICWKLCLGELGGESVLCHKILAICFQIKLNKCKLCSWCS